MKLPFWGTILTIVGVIVLCALGFWQMHRLQWKAGILAAVNSQYEVVASGNRLLLGGLLGEVDFKRGYITGTLDYKKTILLQPRVHDSDVGYHVLTPLIVKGGDGVILVNRGWVPFDWDVSRDIVAGEVKVVGMLRRPPIVSSFVPENIPDKGVWYRIDLEQIAKVKGIEKIMPNIFYSEENIIKGHDYPVASATRVNISNNHAQYVFFWFSMAVAMIVVYVLRFIVPQMRREK